MSEITEIEVTPEMIEAGLDEMREHHYETDTRHMLESVFRAMAYAKSDPRSASLALSLPIADALQDDMDPWLCRQPGCDLRDPHKVVECIRRRKDSQPCPWK